MSKPGYKVERLPLQVIENKLLTRLEDKNTVAILAGKEDIDALLLAIDSFFDHYEGTSFCREPSRMRELQDGLRLLRRSVFKETTSNKPQ